MVEPNWLDVVGCKSRNKNLQRDSRRLIVGGFSFFSSLLMPKETGMFGENRRPIALQCCTCQLWVAMRVDPDDIERHANGMFVQVAFADENGVPYLTPAEREMWISGVCGALRAALPQ